MFETIIIGGSIIDGTGKSAFNGSIGIQGDSIVLLQQDASGLEAETIIDASGYMICPGFIDMHSHSDLALLRDPNHEIKIRQGVTTEVLGMDGLSYAPLSPPNLGPLLLHLAAINGLPPTDMQWGSVKEFLELFMNRVACNVVYFVPHAAIRIEAMGWEARLPTSKELQHMQRLLKNGIKDGAFGFSTGLTYTPGAYSDTNELLALCETVSQEGGLYATHCRYSLGDKLLDPFREAVSIGEQTGVRVHISHYHNPVNGMGEKMLSLVDTAHSAGIDVSYDQYPYEAASTILHSLVPYWVHAGGPQALLQRLQDRQVRNELRDAIIPQWGSNFDSYFFSFIGSELNKEWEGRSLTDYAKAKAKSLSDAVCDLLVEEQLQVAFVARTGNSDNIRTIFQHDAQMIGSDGILTGEKPNPRSYGTFPYILGQLVREECLLPLEKAVQKMTLKPAQRLGIRDRGALQDGMKADLVIFDPTTVNSRATFTNPKQFPNGIHYVFVNGQRLLDNGRITGLRPGKALLR